MLKLRLPSLTFGFALLLLAADISLDFAYAAVPTSLHSIRLGVDIGQFIMMSITMLAAFNWLLESF